MAAQTTGDLQYGVGRWNVGSGVLILLSLVCIVIGVYAYSIQATYGEIVTGLRNIGTQAGAPWGLYVVFLVYFMGIAFAGITVTALARLFNLDALRPISRMATLMSLIAVILGGLAILVDLGRPLRALVYVFLYARPMSPFFGTFTVVIAGYFFATLVYLFLDGRRDAAICAKQTNGALGGLFRCWASGYSGTTVERKRHENATFWLAIAIIPLLVVATSTLGAVFGLQVGRPGWNSALQAPGFVVLAWLSGVGHLAILAAFARGVFGVQDKISGRLFMWLGNLMMVLSAIYLYFMVVELLTGSYQAEPHEARITQALLTGEFAPIFWISLMSLALAFVLLLVQFVQKRPTLGIVALAGILVNIAAIGKRYLIVIPSQTHGTLLPYGTGSYVPTMVEVGVVVGLLGLGVLLFVLFAKLFPLFEVDGKLGEDA